MEQARPHEEDIEKKPEMSKRQKKKLIKWQRILESRKIKKEEKKQNRKRKLNEDNGTDPDSMSSNDSSNPYTKKLKTMNSEGASSLRIAVDMSFDDLMTDRDIVKLLKQVQRSYASNRRSEHPVQLYLTSFNGKSKLQLEKTKCQYQNWDVHIKSDSYFQVFDKEDVVYLTSDSSNILKELDVSKAYIIGGLVDHNHHKGLCHRLAVEQDVAHAQLPISDFVKLNSRKVLTVNHVFEILLRFVETKDWERAFYAVLPPRKLATEDKQVCSDARIVTENRTGLEDDKGVL